MKPVISVKAPARVCLLGDHQDYLQLPVITAAIDRYMILEATPNQSRSLNINFLDLGTTRTINLSHFSCENHKGDFLLSCLQLFDERGFAFSVGYDIKIQSTIPINAGLSSSSALVVAFCKFLNQAYSDSTLSDIAIAELAYLAEVERQGGPGGRMDQYAIALRGVLYLETDAIARFEQITPCLTKLIIAESGIPKDTLGVLRKVRSKSIDAIQSIQMLDSSFILAKGSVQDLEAYRQNLTEESYLYATAAVENHHCTLEGRRIIQEQNLDLESLGKCMYSHHRILANKLDTSHPKIDHLIDLGLQNGAYGGKIVGSGGGGCLCLLAPSEKTEAVITALCRNGAKAAYRVNVVE